MEVIGGGGYGNDAFGAGSKKSFANATWLHYLPGVLEVCPTTRCAVRLPTMNEKSRARITTLARLGRDHASCFRVMSKAEAEKRPSFENPITAAVQGSDGNH